MNKLFTVCNGAIPQRQNKEMQKPEKNIHHEYDAAWGLQTHALVLPYEPPRAHGLTHVCLESEWGWWWWWLTFLSLREIHIWPLDPNLALNRLEEEEKEGYEEEEEEDEEEEEEEEEKEQKEKAKKWKRRSRKEEAEKGGEEEGEGKGDRTETESLFYTLFRLHRFCLDWIGSNALCIAMGFDTCLQSGLFVLLYL